MDELVNLSSRLIGHAFIDFHRQLFHAIDWHQRMIEIRGSRGVGKTTLMLQKARSLRDAGSKVVYASLDMPYFFKNSLYEFAEEFVQYGGEYLFLDEVHRYPAKFKGSDWSLELKNIFDAFPELMIVYSGSSILHLYQGRGDISRRKASYLLNGLSFREYLELRGIMKKEPLTLEEILSKHEKRAFEYCKEMKPLLHFKNYLRNGFYPFYAENEDVYFKQIQEVVNLIIDADVPYLASISHHAREQLKRLLGAISSTVPYVPNMHTLSELIGVTDHRTLLKYLHLLEEAQLIHLVRNQAKGNKQLQKVDKILINNPNLVFALGMNSEQTGTLRETFFYNQVVASAKITFSAKGDFLVNDRFVFEVGGKGKGYRQVLGEKHSFIVSDDIEVGFGNKIPLWLFGFLY
jgi:predicted AAA+ superfamily ATPase